MKQSGIWLGTLLLTAGVGTCLAQPASLPPFQPNYDESKVGTYTLPDPLIRADGSRVQSRQGWEAGQRQAVLALFKEHVYGQMPGRPAGLRFEVQRVDSSVVDGKGIRKFVRIWFTPAPNAPHMDVMLYLPRQPRNVPVFVALNYGNHTTSPDPTIALPENATLTASGEPQPRGVRASRWPVALLLDAGFGLAMANYADLEPDQPTGWKTGIRTTLQAETGLKPAQWGAIGAWAWGMSRIMDYLETDPAVDARRVLVQGHSRLGKAALWAGANDPRFALVISNDSGEGGAALARRNYGETIGRITQAFPYWFVPTYATYTDRPDQLPVDQHALLALSAPRPLYVATAQDDNWSDQYGMFLALQTALPVWDLYGQPASLKRMPPLDQPLLSGPVGFHIRTGKHDVLPFDWQAYIAFAKHVGLVR